ncbi:MAG: GNAT family N-acetyltransferase [Gemmatimonadetes bacterium]|nr:GNAT family N-acetyltransferase [Gemmatimonadota bacterium]
MSERDWITGGSTAGAAAERVLLERLPDAPRWVEARSLLRGRAFRLQGDPADSCVVRHAHLPLGVAIGQPDAALLRAALRDADRWFELLAAPEDSPAIHATLSDWRASPALLHVRAHRSTAVDADRALGSDVIVAAPAPHALIERVPPAWRVWAAVSPAIAARLAGGAIVSMCHAGAVTERWWDVGVDTLVAHRRRGHARACFDALEAWLSSRGLSPIWGSLEDNAESLAMAAALGFEPVDRLTVFTPPERN